MSKKTTMRRNIAPMRKKNLQSEAFYRAIARRLRDRRCDIGLSMSDLSRSSKVSVAAISLIESGRRRCSLDTLLKLSKSLHTTPADILEGIPHK